MSRYDKLPKYHQDRVFEDPILRCDSCQALVKKELLDKIGGCTCGNRRFRNVQTITEIEMSHLKSWGIDEDFLALFEGIPDVEIEGLKIGGLS